MRRQVASSSFLRWFASEASQAVVDQHWKFPPSTTEVLPDGQHLMCPRRTLGSQSSVWLRRLNCYTNLCIFSHDAFSISVTVTGKKARPLTRIAIMIWYQEKVKDICGSVANDRAIANPVQPSRRSIASFVQSVQLCRSLRCCCYRPDHTFLFSIDGIHCYCRNR